jgi:predicted nucleotidyltransferase
VFMERPVSLTPTMVQNLLRELRTSLESMYGDNLVGFRLFGSYARRQATPDSDVDVLLVLREVGDYGTEVRRVSDLLSRVSLEYGKTIAPVFVDAKRFTAASDPFMANVAREAVPA